MPLILWSGVAMSRSDCTPRPRTRAIHAGFQRYNTMKLTGLLTSLVFACAPALATGYFVNNNGSDSNPGTQTAPWKTIAKVNASTFHAGDRILLQGGQTFQGPLILTAASGFGNATNSIGVEPYGSGVATISSTGNGIEVKDTQGYFFANLVIDGGNHATNTGSGIYLVNDRPGNVKIGPIKVDTVTVRNFGYDGISIYGLNGASGWNPVTIINSVIYGNRDGIQSYALANGAHQNIFIDKVVVHDNPGRSGSGNPTGSGIVLGQVDGATIQRCVAHGNGASNTNAAGPVGIWCYDANNVVIQYCESYNNTGGAGEDGDGFDLDINTSNSTLQYNFSHGNTGAGYLIGGGGSTTIGGNTIKYNVSQNDGIKNAFAGIEIYGNVYNDNIESNWLFSGAPAAAGIRISPGSHLTNLRVSKNTVFVTGSLPIVRADTTVGATFSGNDYWRLDGSFLLSWAGVQYSSLSAWKAATGQESGTGSNTSPPLLWSPAPIQ
jgi:Right handed beta helix region